MKRWKHSILLSAALVLAGSPMLAAGSPSHDSLVAEQVRKEIVTLPFYSVFDNVEFELKDGVVELRGEVLRPVMKNMIAKAVNRVEGVDSVVNNLEVQPLSPYDNRLRRALVQRIYGNQMFTRYAYQAVPPIHIVVRNGHVSLEGVVRTEAQKNFAGVMANGVNGVFSVTNNLRTEI